MSDPRGASCSKGTMKENRRPSKSHLLHQLCESALAFHLQLFRLAQLKSIGLHTPCTMTWVLMSSIVGTEQVNEDERTGEATCMIVLQASIGMSTIRKPAAAVDAARVLTPTGRFVVESKLSSRESVPALAAVSPKRDSGPWKSAGARPL